MKVETDGGHGSVLESGPCIVPHSLFRIYTGFFKSLLFYTHTVLDSCMSANKPCPLNAISKQVVVLCPLAHLSSPNRPLIQEEGSLTTVLTLSAKSLIGLLINVKISEYLWRIYSCGITKTLTINHSSSDKFQSDTKGS